MEPFTIGILGLVVLLVLISLGVHVAIALLVVGFFGTTILAGVAPALTQVAGNAFYYVASETFVVIPLFILMGMLATSTGFSSDAYRGLNTWFGRLRGGLGIATVGGCTIFGTVCGSSLVTAAVFARLSAPEMRRQGYEKKFAYAISSSAGTIGMLIPPSILMVIYGILTQESVGKLLIGGIAPGLLLFIIFSFGIVIMTRLNPSLAPQPAAGVKVTWRQRFAALGLMWPAVLTFGIIVGGISFGVFTPSEAGAVASFVFLVIFFAYRRPFQELKTALMDTISTTGMLFLLLVGAMIFGRFLVLSGIATALAGLVVGSGFPPVVVVIMSVFVYILLGCFLDSISMLSITIPAMYPAIMAMGIDPIWYAMVVITAIHIGTITPPVGVNVYAVKGVAEADVSLEDLFRGVLPFLLMMVIAVVILIAFPALSTTLPAVMMK